MGYVVIVGGQLHNKGAQAMTFAVVDEMATRYPKKEVVLLASTYTARDANEERILNFRVLPWPRRLKAKMLGYPYNLYAGPRDFLSTMIKGVRVTEEQQDSIRQVLQNADLMLDVSGYALSSQRGFLASLSYLYNILIARKMGIPVYLLPQSFGPFDYVGRERRVILPLLQECLRYPRRIYVRESDGLHHLKPFNLTNSEQSYDIVLQMGREYTLPHVYKEDEYCRRRTKIDIDGNSVAIVPNEKTMSHGDASVQYSLYRRMIEYLLTKKNKVYVLRHSYEDLAITQRIKQSFADEDNVVLLSADLDCIQISRVLRSLDFLIASRYHSIIHAYKNHVPTLVLGWARKYYELASLFCQEKYLFDVRELQDQNAIMRALDDLVQNSGRESAIIRDTLADLSFNSVFSQIDPKE